MKPNATTKFESLDDYAKKLEHDTAHILECAEVYDNCGLARKKLLGNELTAELFDSLNSIDEGETHGGLDSLLGRIVIPSQDPSENRALKTEILGLIEKNSDASVAEMTSALECYCEDLIRAVTDYDAYVEENSALREKIISGIKGLSDEDIRTVIGMAEKLSYDKSEAGSTDNGCPWKSKNEDGDDKPAPEADKEDGEDVGEKIKAANAAVLKTIAENQKAARQAYDDVRGLTGDFNGLGMSAAEIYAHALTERGIRAENRSVEEMKAVVETLKSVRVDNSFKPSIVSDSEAVEREV